MVAFGSFGVVCYALLLLFVVCLRVGGWVIIVLCATIVVCGLLIYCLFVWVDCLVVWLLADLFCELLI